MYYKKMKGGTMADAYGGEEPSLVHHYYDEIKILLKHSFSSQFSIIFKINDYTLKTFKEHIRTKLTSHGGIVIQDFDIFDETGKKVESIEEFKNKKKYDLLLPGQIVVNTQLEINVRFDSEFNQDRLKKIREVYNLEEEQRIEVVNKETGNIVTDLEHGGNYLIRVFN
jgi:hypothetical protein